MNWIRFYRFCGTALLGIVVSFSLDRPIVLIATALSFLCTVISFSLSDEKAGDV